MMSSTASLRGIWKISRRCSSAFRPGGYGVFFDFDGAFLGPFAFDGEVFFEVVEERVDGAAVEGLFGYFVEFFDDGIACHGLFVE
jgi:hypothetical protein